MEQTIKITLGWATSSFLFGLEKPNLEGVWLGDVSDFFSKIYIKSMILFLWGVIYVLKELYLLKKPIIPSVLMHQLIKLLIKLF